MPSSSACHVGTGRLDLPTMTKMASNRTISTLRSWLYVFHILLLVMLLEWCFSTVAQELMDEPLINPPPPMSLPSESVMTETTTCDLPIPPVSPSPRSNEWMKMMMMVPTSSTNTPYGMIDQFPWSLPLLLLLLQQFIRLVVIPLYSLIIVLLISIRLFRWFQSQRQQHPKAQKERKQIYHDNKLSNKIKISNDAVSSVPQQQSNESSNGLNRRDDNCTLSPIMTTTNGYHHDTKVETMTTQLSTLEEKIDTTTTSTTSMDETNDEEDPMLNLTGLYKLVSNSNLESFLEAQGIPWAIRRAVSQARPIHRITHVGQNLTIKIEGVIIESQTSYVIHGVPVQTNVRGRLFLDRAMYYYNTTHNDEDDDNHKEVKKKKKNGIPQGIVICKKALTDGSYDVTVTRQLSNDGQTITLTHRAFHPEPNTNNNLVNVHDDGDDDDESMEAFYQTFQRRTPFVQAVQVFQRILDNNDS